jgi:hypothetical protein
MGRIPENLGQRIVELARLAAAMHLEMRTEFSPVNRDVARGWDGATVDRDSLSNRQWTRTGGAPLGIVMEDALSNQVDRAALLANQPPRSAWSIISANSNAADGAD